MKEAKDESQPRRGEINVVKQKIISNPEGVWSLAIILVQAAALRQAAMGSKLKSTDLSSSGFSIASFRMSASSS